MTKYCLINILFFIWTCHLGLYTLLSTSFRQKKMCLKLDFIFESYFLHTRFFALFKVDNQEKPYYNVALFYSYTYIKYAYSQLK